MGAGGKGRERPLKEFQTLGGPGEAPCQHLPGRPGCGHAGTKPWVRTRLIFARLVGYVLCLMGEELGLGEKWVPRGVRPRPGQVKPPGTRPATVLGVGLPAPL